LFWFHEKIILVYKESSSEAQSTIHKVFYQWQLFQIINISEIVDAFFLLQAQQTVFLEQRRQ
jgi:hypothetical protein